MRHSVEMLKVSPCPLAQNYWWFIELPYWCKVTFLPKRFEILTTGGEKDNSHQYVFPRVSLLSYI